MAFHNVELPEAVQYGSVAGPGFGTIIQETASGHEYRVARQSQGRLRFRLAKELQTNAEAVAIKTFALARRGALNSWKLKDWSDYTTASDNVSAPSNLDHIIGVGDGTEDTFQLLKYYDAAGPAPYLRAITLPVTGTVVVALNTVNTTAFTVSGSGQVVLNTPPAGAVVVTAGCEFRVPVRFSAEFDAWAQMQADAYNVWSLPTLDAVEVLSEVELPERWYAGGGRDWGATANNVRLSLNDGALQYIDPTAAISMYLPPVARIPSGDRIFTVAVKAGATGTVQLKDDLGASIGSTMAAGVVKQVAMIRGASTSTWIRY